MLVGRRLRGGALLFLLPGEILRFKMCKINYYWPIQAPGN